jgi:uncharacterized protein YbbK (DUF523 family)
MSATLVSACLLGFPCRHDGRDKRDERVLAVLEESEVVPVCPEMAGGLPTPRAPSWWLGQRLVDANGADVTAQFEAGAQQALQAARAHGCGRAILKQNSPSCGTRRTGTAAGRAEGQGLTALRLRQAGLAVLGEDDL